MVPIISFSKIYSKENLMWSWNKLNHYYENESDFIPNIEEYYAFSLDLVNNLQILRDKIKTGQFHTHKIVDMYMPKKVEDGKPVFRPYYYVNIEDQIVWIAVMNVIGPVLDEMMPFWSFGNRLNVPQWNDENGERRIGVYRLSSKTLYRSWKHGWSWYKRTVALCCKTMTTDKMENMLGIDEEDSRDIDDFGNNKNEYIPDYLKIKYLDLNYWLVKDNNIYYCTLDLKKFYPNINIELIKQNLLKYLYQNKFIDFDEKEKIINLIDELLDFKYESLCEENKGIPTGLYVAGLLSNIAMLDIDKKIDKYREQKVSEKINIANFRYVDDQIILSNDFSELLKWVNEYKRIIYEYGLGLEINSEKYEPQGIKELIQKDVFENDDEYNNCFIETQSKSLIDPDLSNPFSTATLKRVSIISKKNINFLDDSEKEDIIQELIVLLKSDLDEKEIAPKTKFSWVTTLLNKIVPSMDKDSKNKLDLLEKINQDYYKLLELKKEKSKLKDLSNDNNSYELDIEIFNTINQIRVEEEKIYNFNSNNAKFNEIFVYIKKSLNDYYYLPTMWSKAISYCRLTCINCINEIFDIIDKLKIEAKIEKNGYNYIKTIIVQEICDEMIISLKNCYNNNHIKKISKESLYRSHKFIENVLNLRDKISHFENSYVFLNDKIKLFMQLCNYAKNAYDFLVGDSDFIISLYVYEKAFKNSNKFIKYNGTFYDNCIKNFICANKKRIETKSLKKIKCETPYHTNLIKEEIELRKPLKGFSKKLNFLNFIKCLNLKEFYLLNNEYVLLTIGIKILEQISLYESKNFYISNDEKFRYNYSMFSLIIDIDKIVNSANLNDYFNNIDEIKIILNKKDIEYIDPRYSPDFFKTSTCSNRIFRNIYFIGLILISMFSKNLDCPSLVNLYPNSINLSKLHLSRMSELNISSIIFAIIKGCITQKEYEIDFSKDFIALNLENRIIKYDYDPIPIKDLEQLEKYLEITKHYLKSNIYNLENGKLKFFKNISTNVYCKKNNPFEVGEDNEQ